MRSTPATAALTRAGVGFVERTYSHLADGTSYGEQAARALGVDPRQLFKTLLVQVDQRLVVALVPVAGQLDLKALAAAVGGKRGQLAAPAVAERATGYVVGGISPLGQRRRLTTVVDDSATAHPTVWVSGGRRGLQLELAPDDLIALTDAVVAPVSR
ncbi:MAG: Cys-tRNA(Pro) deacylase [Nocardioidaceae bacterium]|nr:Cys-tRNA(Pro) deacylase [Nocardioidaceae bacterium]